MEMGVDFNKSLIVDIGGAEAQLHKTRMGSWMVC